MRNKFDNILLGTLWLLLSTLGACFWFNTQFGFNILSGTHWRHLAYMQVTQTQIKPLFYISIIIAVFCIVFGLYLLIRPRFRKIKLPQSKKTNEQTQPVTHNSNTNDPDVFALARPKRLNGMHTNTPTTHIEIMTAPVAGAPSTAPVLSPPTPTSSATPEQEDTELQEIFSSAGYVIKKSPRVHGYRIPLFAIGSNETVWIGGRNIETSTMQSIIDAFQQVFSDTLEDVEIKTTGFVIAANDVTNPPAPEILNFKDTDELRAYISQNPNPPTAPDMAENFDAFSGYISTVIDYIGHL